MTERGGNWGGGAPRLRNGAARLCPYGTFPPAERGGGAGLGGERIRHVQSVLSGWVAWAVQRRRGWSLRAGLGGSPGFLPPQE